MAELPEGWTIDVDRGPDGVNTYALRRWATGYVLPDPVMKAATRPSSDCALVEYCSLPEHDAEYLYRDVEEWLDVGDLHARAVLLERVAEDLEERDRTTSREGDL